MPGKTLKATAVLIGTTVGAGIFGLPFAVVQVGFAAGIIYLLALGALVLLLNLIYGEVILRTPGDHQLTGYGEIYFGRWGKLVATASLLIGIYGALWAYLLKIGGFLALFSPPVGGQAISFSPTLFSLGFFCLASLAILIGLRAVSLLEVILVSLMLLFIFILATVGLPHLSLANYSLIASPYSLNALFFPYGIILFTLTGFSAIPEMEEVLRHQHGQLKRAVISGTIIPILVYLIFVFVIVGISGGQTSEDAISSLVMFLPSWVVKLGAGLGILTMSTSFLSLGYVLREVWFRDFRLPRPAALTLALLPLLLLFLLGTKNFLLILEYTGAITGGLSGLLIVALFLKAKSAGQQTPAYRLNVPKIILGILGIIFILGMFSPLV